MLQSPFPPAYYLSKSGTVIGDRMLHRHLNHQKLTLAAIDDVIGRGQRQDWAQLRQAALADRGILEKVLRICAAHVEDPYAQRYHFWKHYAERHLA